MFEFDFDDLGEVEGDIKGRTAGALRGRGAFSSKIEAEAPRAPAKSKATAKPKAKAKVQEDLLGALAAEEDARAAEMLARLAPPMHGYTPSPAAPAAPTAPAAPALAPVQPVAQAAPEVLKQSAQRTSKPEKSVPRPREDIERVEENPRPLEDEDKAYRAAAEAAAERALERDRNSDWWKKLQAQTKPSPVARCERLPIHRDPTGKRKTCPLPTRGFKVLVEAHPVRSQPCAGALVCGGRKQNEIIRAVEETFDGWVKLAEEDGWMCQGAEEGNSVKKCLEALEKPRAVAVETLAKTPGRQMVEVVADDGVDILQEPVEGALVLGRRSFGEFLLADSQTYHGWIRLSDDEGWAQAVSGSGERMLMGIRPDELQLTTTDGEAAPEEAQKEQTAAAMVEAARREALRQLESAALSGNSAFFCAALEVARQQGVSKKDIAKANAMRS